MDSTIWLTSSWRAETRATWMQHAKEPRRSQELFARFLLATDLLQISCTCFFLCLDIRICVALSNPATGIPWNSTKGPRRHHKVCTLCGPSTLHTRHWWATWNTQDSGNFQPTIQLKCCGDHNCFYRMSMMSCHTLGLLEATLH